MIDPRWLFIAMFILAQPTIVGLDYLGDLRMTGKATYYAAPYLGRPMRNGVIYTDRQMICAVDRYIWNDFMGKILLVCSRSKCVSVEVADTGNLSEHNVVLDLSVRAFKMLRDYGAPWDNDGVLNVNVWMLGN